VDETRATTQRNGSPRRPKDQAPGAISMRRRRAGSPRRPKDQAPGASPPFPPGRYGRRRDGRRHLTVPIVFGVLVVLLSVLIAVRLYRQYGDPRYDAQTVGWTDVADTQMTIRFTVRVPPGGAASCLLRARSYDGTEVGSRAVTVAAHGTDTMIHASETVPTTARAVAGDVIRCRRPG
jgi:Domain of unknown function (DUF4307)